MEAGGLANAFGNGVAYPFTVIYLHNVRGFSLGIAGLVLATNAMVGLGAGPLAGIVVDLIGGRVTLAASLVLMAVGFGAFPWVTEPWHAFVASAVAGVGKVRVAQTGGPDLAPRRRRRVRQRARGDGQRHDQHEGEGGTEPSHRRIHLALRQ